MSSQSSPAFRRARSRRLRVAVQHQPRVDAGETEGDEPRPGLEPQPGAGGLARDQHRRGPVADLARVARGHPSFRDERRLEGCERLGRGVRPRSLVHGEEDAHVRVRDLDRDDLVLEPPLGDRRERATVRLERVGVELLAREAPLLGDQLGRDALRHELPAFHQRIRNVAAARAHRHARHRLDPGRDDEVELARPDGGRRVEVALHRRAALPIDRRARHRLRPARHERRHPADVPALLAYLRDAAHLDVLDLGRIDVASLHEGVEDLPGELVGP